MAKEVKTVLTLQIPAGKANPAPPLGPALGQHGVAIQEFCSKFNEKTRELGDWIIPAIVTIYKDRSFTFVLKQPPVYDMIRKMAKVEKGSGEPNKNKVGKLTWAQCLEIATKKMPDMNAADLESGARMVAGSARSMGITVDGLPEKISA